MREEEGEAGSLDAGSDRAIFVGRFQPYHRGHHEAVKFILGKYSELVIVVGSAQENYTWENPFTAGERVEMISRCLRRDGLYEKCYVIPVPDILESAVWVKRVVTYSPKVNTVFSNNSLTAVLFKADGFTVKLTPIFGDANATKIREMIAKGDPNWKKLVPADVADFIEAQDLTKRVKELKKIPLWKQNSSNNHVA